MKVLAVLALTLFSMSGAKAQNNDPTVVSVALGKAYIPGGFDSNDIPQIVVTGTFPDLCHQVATQEITVDEAKARISIRQKAYRYSGNYCWAVKAPFEQTATLSPLRAGTYTVWDETGGKTLGHLIVMEASHSGPGTVRDDFPYAPVSDVQLKPRSPFGHTLVVSGTFPNDCLSLLDVKIIVQREVVVVQPILQYTPTASGFCTEGYYPYRKEKALPELLGKHSYLIHARSMNGQAVNRLVDPYKNFPFDPASP